MGFTIIANAFKSKVKALEEDLKSANEDLSQREEKMALMHQKITKLERENLEASLLQGKVAELEEKLIEKSAELETRRAEYTKREQELLADNRRLAQHTQSLKRKATQLETFRRIVVDTIKNEEDFPGHEQQSAKVLDGPTSIIPGYATSTNNTTTNRIPDYQQQSHCRSSLHAESNLPQPGESDSRRLFRHARAKLSMDQFEQFVSNVRRFNAQQVSAKEALAEAEKICGFEHPSIFEEFKGLLLPKSRHRRQSTY